MNHFELHPFGRLHRSFFSPTSFFDEDAKSSFTPYCEVSEEDKHFLVSLDVPGISQDNIDIEVKDNELHISGERKSLVKDERSQSLRTERKYGRFSRVFTIPTNVQVNAIEAKFENGVLDLILPKMAEAQPRKIQINGLKVEQTQ